MVQSTTRDKIWTHALNIAFRQREAVKPADILDRVDCSERTVRDTLNVMTTTGSFLRRETRADGSVRYLPDDTLHGGTD